MRHLIFAFLTIAGWSSIATATTGNLSHDTIVYKKVGNLDIHASVYPADGEDAKPAILYLHGGGMVAYGLGYFEEWDIYQVQRFHDAGYVVVNIEYRLAPQTKLPEIFSDVESAYTWMRNQGAQDYGINPDRIAVMGHSAGGYLAALSGARLSPKPAAVVIASGYSDINGDWYAKPWPFYLQQPLVSESDAIASLGVRNGEVSSTDDPTGDTIFGNDGYWVYLRQNGLWPLEVTGHDPTDTQWFHDWNPVELVTPDYPPAFIIHGGKDTDVPVAQAEQMNDALLANGVSSTFAFAADGVHCFDALGVTDPVPSYVPPILDQLDAFLRSNIGYDSIK